MREESRGGLARLPEDVSDPFDNDFATQQPSFVAAMLVGMLAQHAWSRR